MIKEQNNKELVRRRRNFVAKHARTYNKAVTHRDRTKYRRTNKEWKIEITHQGG